MLVPPLTRRGFLGSAVAAGAGLLAGCEITELIPGLDDLELGDAHLVWDPVSGAIYRLFATEHRVARVTLDGEELWSFGGPGQLAQQVASARNLAVGPDGSLFIADPGNDRIIKLHEDGRLDRLIGVSGEGDGQLRGPQALTVDDNGVLWVADTWNHRVVSFEPDGRTRSSFGALAMEPAEGEFNMPRSVARDPEGLLHVVDAGHARVQVFDTDGNHQRTYGEFGDSDGQHFRPRSVAIAPTGNAFVSDPILGVVQVYGPQGTPLIRFQELSFEGLSASPLDIGFTDSGLLYVRVHAYQVENPEDR